MQQNVIDRIIIGAVALLAALPFSQVFYFKIAGGMLNTFEVIYVALAMLIMTKILAVGKIRKTYLPFLLFTAMITLYFFISLIFYNISVVAAARQLRNYFPFLIGTMLLMTGTSVTTKRYLLVLSSASIFSSTAAIFFHHLMPDLLVKMLSSSEHLVLMTTNGRLYWANSSLFFFVLLSFMLLKERSQVNKVIISTALLLTFACLLNTLNRTMMIGLLLFLVGYIFLEKRVILSIKRFTKVIGILTLGTVIVICTMFFIPKVNYLIEKRYIGSDHEFDHIYKTAVVMGRFPIYEQYANSIKTYFPIGQGLGKPFDIRLNGDEITITDISIISFLLPFGLLGLIVFCDFIYTLFRLISRANNCINESEIRVIKLFFIISFIISLNIDLFSRNNFVIYSTLFVMTLQNDFSPKLISNQPGDLSLNK